VAVSADSSCVKLGSNNGVHCWGRNLPLDLLPFGTPEQLVAGNGHVCAISAQQASCVGSNFAGQLGDNTFAAQAFPVAVNSPPALFSTISAGNSHTCGLTPDGDAYCWGRALEGQIGNGATNWGVGNPQKVDVL
jgi:alpha-tubulin suppressor-like RCC1 family protein